MTKFDLKYALMKQTLRDLEKNLHEFEKYKDMIRR